MEAQNYQEIFERIKSNGILPIFSHADANVVVEVARACARGGSKVFELTNRNESSLEAFIKLQAAIKTEGLTLTLGAGTILNVDAAKKFIDAGATFLIAPSFNADVAALCSQKKIPYMPGCYTPTEIARAEEAGCAVVKYFPADPVIGPSFIKALRGPCPWIKVVATGGIDVSKESFKKWFDAGVAAVGLGSNLTSSALVEAKDYAAITKRVEQALALVKEVRG